MKNLKEENNFLKEQLKDMHKLKDKNMELEEQI